MTSTLWAPVSLLMEWRKLFRPTVAVLRIRREFKILVLSPQAALTNASSFVSNDSSSYIEFEKLGIQSGGLVSLLAGLSEQSQAQTSIWGGGDSDLCICFFELWARDLP